MALTLTILLGCSVFAFQIGHIAAVDKSGNVYEADVFKSVVESRHHENVVFSPVSLGTCVALAYFGAEGKTAQEIKTGLGLSEQDDRIFGEKYAEFIKNSLDGGVNGDRPILKMANRIYVNKDLDIKPEFNAAVTKYFDTQAQQVDFGESKATVHMINSWVEEKTNHKIKDLLSSVKPDTSSVFINAIYFKAKWTYPFSLESTRKTDFFVGAKETVSVDTMYQEGHFKYIELPEMESVAIELPYKDSEMSMMIVLPNKIDGLTEMEKNCDGKKLKEIGEKMKFEYVSIKLPRFKIEFDLDMKDSLAKLGFKKMFSNEAEFTKMFVSGTHKIDEARHKAYLDVNEAGSEAAAASFLTMVPASLNLGQKSFNADHPFVFAIRDSRTIYFAGHFIKP